MWWEEVGLVLQAPVQAGELLATFEMFELCGEGEGAALPPLPPPKEGALLPVPPHIRPTLVKYRSQNSLDFLDKIML